MDRLIEGVSKFQNEVFPKYRELYEQLANAQLPETLFITCADSRIVPDLITQTKPGELFICRNAGNMVPAYGEVYGGVSATIEYAVTVLPIKDIVVCGHTGCGAMKALLHPEQAEGMPTVKSWLSHGEVARRIVLDNYGDLNEHELLHRITEQNIVAQLEHLRTHPSVASRLARGTLKLHGWMYHIRTGEVDVWNPQTRRFIAIDEYGEMAAAAIAQLQLAS